MNNPSLHMHYPLCTISIIWLPLMRNIVCGHGYIRLLSWWRRGEERTEVGEQSVIRGIRAGSLYVKKIPQHFSLPIFDNKTMKLKGGVRSEHLSA